MRNNARARPGRAFRRRSMAAALALMNQLSRERTQAGRGVPVLQDLTVLTPPLVVCVAFLIAVGAFLRHEMRPGRRQREDDTSVDFSDDGGISEPPDREGPAHEAPEHGDVEDAQDPIDGG